MSREELFTVEEVVVEVPFRGSPRALPPQGRVPELRPGGAG